LGDLPAFSCNVSSGRSVNQQDNPLLNMDFHATPKDSIFAALFYPTAATPDGHGVTGPLSRALGFNTFSIGLKAVFISGPR
jgi:hypothetical protein